MERKHVQQAEEGRLSLSQSLLLLLVSASPFVFLSTDHIQEVPCEADDENLIKRKIKGDVKKNSV